MVAAMATLCLGEALVDLICTTPAAGLAEADAFVAHFGGATANVCVNAVRHGGTAAIAGGAGDDPWGRWLRDELDREGVDTHAFALSPDGVTTLAFVTVDSSGEPTYAFYGDALAAGVGRLGDSVEDAVRGADALYFASSLLARADAREVTLRARELALAAGKPIYFDPNLRLTQWASESDALDAARLCIEGAAVVKANGDEVRLLTGEDDPARGADALVTAGAQLAVVTLGAEGAIARGREAHDVPGVPAEVRSTVGAGDAFMGVLLARLEPDGVLGAMKAASEAAARVTESWGAVA